jgi:hypothetical protein
VEGADLQGIKLAVVMNGELELGDLRWESTVGRTNFWEEQRVVDRGVRLH